MLYTVKYRAGPYQGEKAVFAVTADDAIRQVQAWAWDQGVRPPCLEHYEIVGVREAMAA